MKGLANIPILIALALIIGITPFAINQVQKNQNLQNRAATFCDCSTEQMNYCSGESFVLKCNPQIKCPGKRNCTPTYNQIPCEELVGAKNTYCDNTSPNKNKNPSVPCTEITKVIAENCNKIKPSLAPTSIPRITKTPYVTPTTTTTSCTKGQTKCVGRMVFVCNVNSWTYSQICPDTCNAGMCVSKSIN